MTTPEQSKSPSVFSVPPPREENLRIPEFDRNGKPVVWTMEDALEGKCNFDQIDCTRYYEKHLMVSYEMYRWNRTLREYIEKNTIGEVMAERLEDAQDRWEKRKREFDTKVALDDFLLRGGSQLHGYTLIPQSKYAETASLAWQSRVVSSPIVVMSRGESFARGRRVNVRVLTPEGKWVSVSIPAAELNDHGAKLGARLLNEGAIVSVDTEDRKRLLHFILNAQAFDQGAA